MDDTDKARLPASAAITTAPAAGALLKRDDVAAALTAAGYPIAGDTLRTKATRGGGPRYQLFGRTALYKWSDAIAWAEGRLTPPRRSSSEADAQHAA